MPHHRTPRRRIDLGFWLALFASLLAGILASVGPRPLSAPLFTIAAVCCATAAALFVASLRRTR